MSIRGQPLLKHETKRERRGERESESEGVVVEIILLPLGRHDFQRELVNLQVDSLDSHLV